MIEEKNFETYLSVTINKFEIFFFDKKKNKNLYTDELEIKNEKNFIDLINLSKFLDNNIFKIEKLSGEFVKSIYLIVEIDTVQNLNICVKKKFYDDTINQKNLENTLIELKDLFKENHQEQKIMHMLIKNYIINGKSYPSFVSDIGGDYLCLEVSFISISSELTFVFDKILEKYQIKVNKYLDLEYLNKFFESENLTLPKMADKIINGYNKNEVILIPKNIENKGFFEKFFQLFS